MRESPDLPLRAVLVDSASLGPRSLAPVARLHFVVSLAGLIGLVAFVKWVTQVDNPYPLAFSLEGAIARAVSGLACLLLLSWATATHLLILLSTARGGAVKPARCARLASRSVPSVMGLYLLGAVLAGLAWIAHTEDAIPWLFLPCVYLLTAMLLLVFPIAVLEERSPVQSALQAEELSSRSRFQLIWLTTLFCGVILLLCLVVEIVVGWGLSWMAVGSSLGALAIAGVGLILVLLGLWSGLLTLSSALTVGFAIYWRLTAGLSVSPRLIEVHAECER